jgi:hypothetical protein
MENNQLRLNDIKGLIKKFDLNDVISYESMEGGKIILLI